LEVGRRHLPHPGEVATVGEGVAARYIFRHSNLLPTGSLGPTRQERVVELRALSFIAPLNMRFLVAKVPTGNMAFATPIAPWRYHTPFPTSIWELVSQMLKSAASLVFDLHFPVNVALAPCLCLAQRRSYRAGPTRA